MSRVISVDYDVETELLGNHFNTPLRVVGRVIRTTTENQGKGTLVTTTEVVDHFDHAVTLDDDA